MARTRAGNCSTHGAPLTNGQTGLKSAGADATIAELASFDCKIPVGSETPESTTAMRTGVIGPGGQVYLTDGHHTLTSFWEAPGGGPDTHVRLKTPGTCPRSR